MYKPITYSLLVQQDACHDQLALFKKHFGKVKAIPLTKKVVAKFCNVFDIIWAAQKFLTKEDSEKFWKAKNAAYSKYRKVTTTAYEKYKKAKNVAYSKFESGTAHAGYWKIDDLGLAEYMKVREISMEEYNKVNDTARAKYYKFNDIAKKTARIIAAQAFVHIYKKGMK